MPLYGLIHDSAQHAPPTQFEPQSATFTETALQAAKANLSHVAFLKGYTQLQQLDNSV